MANSEQNNNKSEKTDKADDTAAEDITSQEIDFHGATVIDEDGKETPITEEMVQRACSELEESCNKDDKQG